tara:strand:+ start:311 stop:931 length:621 start_codon:yes stop_codon:yes gene_type:complete
MGKRGPGLARAQALIENLKRELNLSTSTTLQNAKLTVAAEAATYGAGAVSTEIAPQTFIQDVGGEIITTILVDLTGLKTKSTAQRVIGLASGGAAYLLEYKASTSGILYKAEMECLELPTGGGDVNLDIDIRAVDADDKEYNSNSSSYRVILNSGGDMAKGQTFESLSCVPNDSDYVYMSTGAAESGDDTYTAGKIVIRLFGRKTF